MPKRKRQCQVMYTELIQFRCTKLQYNIIREWADNNGVSVGSFVRMHILQMVGWNHKLEQEYRDQEAEKKRQQELDRLIQEKVGTRSFATPSSFQQDDIFPDISSDTHDLEEEEDIF